MRKHSFVSAKRIKEQEDIENLEKMKEVEGVNRFDSDASSANKKQSQRPWPVVSADDVARSLHQKSAVVIDIRSAKEIEWGKIKGSATCPFTIISGSSMSPIVSRNDSFLKLVANLVGNNISSKIILVGSVSDSRLQHGQSKEKFKSKAVSLSTTEDYVLMAALTLTEAGYTDLSELEGGFTAYDLRYRPDGKRREVGNWRDKSSGELEYWTASN